MPRERAEHLAQFLDPWQARLGWIVLFCGMLMVLIGFPAQIHKNWIEGACGIDPLIVTGALLVYLVRIPYQITKRAWHLLPADTLGLLLSIILMIQYLYYGGYTITDVSNVLAGVFLVGGFIPYLHSVVYKGAQPMKSSWFIWALLDSTIFFGMLLEDSVNGQMIGAIIGSWTTFCFAWKYGESQWSKLDKASLTGAVTGIGIGIYFSDPKLTITSSLVVMFIGSIPTIESAWGAPEKELKISWWIWWVSCVFALIAVPARTLEDAGQPITFFIIETIMVFILFVRPRMLRKIT
ncbi:hypothetical protein HQ487_01980 [Candidatus Uhrbacteria bacterium]|nr:hypothetical protein [Candidatus Uhrbacteria bacterium]